MKSLPPNRIARALAPYLFAPGARQCQQIASYAALLLKWNDKVNLTSIVQPDEILARHFGESLFAASQIAPDSRTLLDVGSGAGFPGLALKIARPEIEVTLLEPVLKKVAFLKEAARTLEFPATILACRVEDLPPQSALYDVITTRAVKMQPAILRACDRLLAKDGCLICWTAPEDAGRLRAAPEWVWEAKPIPKSENRILLVGQKLPANS